MVLGHRAEAIAPTLAGEGVRIVLNPRYREGMLASVQAGIAAAAPETEWFVIAPGDQPGIRPEVVRALLEAVASEAEPRATLAVPCYRGRRGHPLVVHRAHREEIAALDPGEGLRALLRRHPEAIRHVPVDDEEVCADLDTPEDYERALRRREALSREDSRPA